MRNYLFAFSLFVFCFDCHAEEFPRLKAGLWQMETNAGPMPISAEYCVDAATQDKLFEKSGQMGACAKPTVSRSGDTYIMNTSCSDHGKTNEVRSKITFHGDESFTGETLVSGRSLRSNGTYLGKCAPGQRPGSMQIKGPGGMQFDLDQMQEMLKGIQKNMRN